MSCSSCGAPVPAGGRFCPACGHQQDGAAPERPADELRPITALFADVVGSTSLGERLSPDEVRALIGECVSRMSRAVEEFGGTVQAYMGDGIAAYFGIPAAHEDDAERAARAALRILEVIREYAQDIAAAWGITDFNVRVGLNTGQVGVGLVGGAAPQQVGLGDATNVAARLQGAAEPGSIVVGEPTARLLAVRFVLDPLGEIALKGRQQPVPAWRLVAPRTEDESALDSPLVGRDAELDRLRHLVDELLSGRGQVLELVGEVGIGKSRLLRELRGLGGERVTWLEGRCVSYGGDLPHAPFVEILREWLGVAEGEAEVAVRTRLRARLASSLGERLDEALPPLARFLGVRLDAEAERSLDAVPPAQLGERLRAAYRAWIEALARSAPVVLAIEDMHWADPSTRELAEDLLEVTDRMPLLLAATMRREPSSEGWRFRLRVLGDYAHRSTSLDLGPLSREASERLAESSVGSGALDPWTMGAIVERAEGNPLYLEELVRGLVEAGMLERRRSWTLTVSSQDVLPPALESLLIARIDRLSPSARRTTQAAAVIGRTVPMRLLERVVGEPVEDDVALLLRADLIREHRRHPEPEFTFKHGLLQEAALSTLPEAGRRELAQRVAQAAEQLYASSLEEHLEVLAHWFTEGRDLAKALGYLERAAEKAASQGAIEEARELLARAAKVASRLGDESAAERIAARTAALA